MRIWQGYEDVIATCIGHTHIDVAWWWTVAQTREKVGRSFATVLKLMDEYPNYKFMSSQPQLYAFLKKNVIRNYTRKQNSASKRNAGSRKAVCGSRQTAT